MRRNADATIQAACARGSLGKSTGGMMMPRTIENWKALLRGKFPQDAAQRILRDIPHYRKGGGYECQDIEQLANALEAFASLQEDAPAKRP
jgi:hypothetical protein